MNNTSAGIQAGGYSASASGTAASSQQFGVSSSSSASANSGEPTPAAAPTSTLSALGAGGLGNPANEIYSLVQQLLVIDQREDALTELSKRRESFVDLAPILW